MTGFCCPMYSRCKMQRVSFRVGPPVKSPTSKPRVMLGVRKKPPPAKAKKEGIILRP